MTNWIVEQFETLNVLSIIIMILFVTAMSKANTQKMLKEQSQELYAEFEEIKDEIRGNSRARN
jgi:ABC-type transporter MlaC component